MEARSAVSEIVATPTTSGASAEDDVVSGRQALGVRRIQTGRSAIVYGTRSTAGAAISGAAVRNDCGQCSAFGKGREVAEGFASVSDLCVGVGEPIFKLFNAGYLPGEKLTTMIVRIIDYHTSGVGVAATRDKAPMMRADVKTMNRMFELCNTGLHPFILASFYIPVDPHYFHIELKVNQEINPKIKS